MVALAAVLTVVAAVGPSRAFGPSAAAAEEPPADVAAPGAALVEICAATGLADVPEIGSRLCTSFDAGAVALGGLCRQTPIPAEVCAALTDGRVIDPAIVDAFQRSWVHRALRLQERLDRGVPLRDVLVPHTHNSYNANAYPPSLSTADPNQHYSLTDQLRMGIRGIELDLHWVPQLATGGQRAVALCHAQQVPLDLVTIHLGCTVDRLFTDGLAEVAAYLRAPGNEDVFVVLYLENQLEDDPTAHRLAVDALARHLGDLVARPPAGQPCAPFPLDTNRADLMALGHRVLLVGNCGPGAWGTWVHERGDRWEETQSRDLTWPACAALRGPERWDERWIRIYEDATWLSAMVGGGSFISAAETRAMVRCGVNMIGFDRLEPDDGRLEALVWSWAPDEPADDAGACARSDPDGRFRATGCTEVHRPACRTAAGTWTVGDRAVPWAGAADACAALDARFAVPATGWDNEQLRAAAVDAGAATLWLDHARVDGEWRVAPTSAPDGTGAVPTDPAAPEGGRDQLPATGASATVPVALGLLGAALGLSGLLRRRST